MTDREKIAEINKEIAEKKAEIRALKEGRSLNFGRYSNYMFEKYHGNSLSYVEIITEIRKLAVCLLSIEEHCRADGSYYLSVPGKKPKIMDLSKKQISFCNDFIDEIYPIIAKYASIILSKESEELKNEL